MSGQKRARNDTAKSGQWKRDKTEINGARPDIVQQADPKDVRVDFKVLYHVLFENANDAVFLMDFDTFIECNPKTLELFSCTREQIIGKTPYDPFSPEFQNDGGRSKDKALEKITRATKGQSQSFEWSHLRYDGSPLETQVSLNPVELNGKTFIQAIVRDITERKKNEKALRAERDKLQSLMDGIDRAGIGIDIVGTDYQVSFQSKTLEDKFGKPHGMCCFEHYMAMEGPCDPCPAIQAIREKNAVSAEKKGLDDRLYQVFSAPLPDANGTVNKAIEVILDITERKQAEEELKKSEKRYRLLVEYASDSIFLLDMDGSFLDVNPAACDNLGRTREELLALTVSNIDADWSFKKMKTFLRDLVVGKPVTVEGTHRRKNQTSYPVEIRMTKIDVDKRPVVLALTRDITQRHRIEESLRRKAEAVSHEDKVHISGIDIEWDHEKGVCTFEKLPVAMMWIDTTLAGVMSGVQAMVGTERFGLALQGEGRKSVEDDWRVISQFPDFKRGFEAIANIAAVAGWGNWKLIEIDYENKECLFRVWNSWEGLYQKALGVSWGSGMLAGKLAGYCSMLFKTNCWADQTTFVAKGDAFDEFRVHTSNRSIEKEIENLLATDKATRADMAVALQKLRTEIAARKGMEQALRDSEQHYRAIVEDQTELICRYLPDCTITFVNDAYCRYFAKSRDELIGHKFIPLIPETDHQKVIKHFASLGRSHPVATHEHRVMMPNGEIRWHQWTNRAILDKAGKVIEFQGTGRDITKQKLVEEQLRENEKRFRSLSKAAFEGIVFTEKGRIVDFNEAFAKIFGYSLEELKDKQVIELVVLEDRVRVTENISTGYTEIYEHKGLRKDGSFIDLEVQGRNVTYQGRKMRLTAVRDITERKRVEKRLQLYQAKLKSLMSELALAEERERRRIAAGIHDDMAQKLAMAKFELQSLGASVADRNIAASLKGPCDLIDEIVEDARGLVFELGNAALYQVGLEAAVESWLQHDIQGKYGLKCELVKDTSGRKLDDDTQITLFRAVKELVTNAVKYANAHRITVLIQETDGTILVTVEDDGVGFDISKLDASLTPKGGFGLFNIKERLEYLGGHLEILSGLGEGTRVTMEAPLRQDSMVG